MKASIDEQNKLEDRINELEEELSLRQEFESEITFDDGRMVRLWHTALLYNWRSIFEYIPLESQIEKF